MINKNTVEMQSQINSANISFNMGGGGGGKGPNQMQAIELTCTVPLTTFRRNIPAMVGCSLTTDWMRHDLKGHTAKMTLPPMGWDMSIWGEGEQ